MGAIREADRIELALLMTCTWPGNAKSYIRRSERYWGNTYITEYQADGEYFWMSFSTRNASSEYRFARSYTSNEISSFLLGTHEYWYVGFYYFHLFYSTRLMYWTWGSALASRNSYILHIFLLRVSSTGVGGLTLFDSQRLKSKYS